MKLRPLFDRIIVKRLDPEAKTSGGIIIPDSAQNKPTEGFVLAVGKGVKDLKEGDKILFSKFTGAEIKFENKTYLTMKELDILGVVE